jgi:hypothetical protein
MKIRDYTHAYIMNQHPVFQNKDRVTALWYCSDAQFDAAIAKMEAEIEASGIPLDVDGIQQRANENRHRQILAELEGLQYCGLGVNIARRDVELRRELALYE